MRGRNLSARACLVVALAVSGSAFAADLTRVYDVALGGGAEEYVSGAAKQGILSTPDGADMQVQFSMQWGQIGQKFTAPRNWGAYNGYTFVAENLEAFPVSFGFRIDNNAGYTSYAGTNFELQPFERRRFYMELNGFDSSTAGMLNGPPVMNPFYTQLKPWGAVTQPTTVHRWMIYYRGNTPARIKISDLDAVEMDYSLANLVDSFGQYTGRTWVEKATTEQDLVVQKADEDADLALNPGTGENWGSKNLRRQPPGDRWTMHKTPGGKWYFRTPGGRMLWSFGVTGVTNSMPTITGNRLHMFENLPGPGAPTSEFFGSHNGQETYDFYKANLARKFGPTWSTDWAVNATRRLKSWGFNTAGAGSWLAVSRGELQYVVTLSTDDFPTRLTTEYAFWRPLPDPFDPTFESWMVTNFKPQLQHEVQNRNLMGVYVDCEHTWGLPQSGKPYMVPLNTLQKPLSQPAKLAFVNMLKSTYSDIADLNRVWNTNFSSWTQVEQPLTLDPNSLSAGCVGDLSRFLRYYANIFHLKARTAVRRLGLRGLYLGSRDALYFTPDEVFQGSAFWVDVISINHYTDAENVPWQILNSLGKPVMISEFAFIARDRGAFGVPQLPMVETPDQATRAAEADQFIRAALQQPNVVGVHWYNYNDQPSTGRLQDGENISLGVVDVTDRPYDLLIDTFRDIADDMYAYRGE